MKKYLFVFMLFLFSQLSTCASEKVPIFITPNELISTNKDDVDIGDTLSFILIKDVYVSSKLLYPKNTPVEAYVDYVYDNGFVADSAYIQISEFRILNQENKWDVIPYPLKIYGNECRSRNEQFLKKNFHYVAKLIRGDEVNIEPGMKNFTLFISR